MINHNVLSLLAGSQCYDRSLLKYNIRKKKLNRANISEKK